MAVSTVRPTATWLLAGVAGWIKECAPAKSRFTELYSQAVADFRSDNAEIKTAPVTGRRGL